MSHFKQLRFYEEEFPEPNQLVMVRVSRIEQTMGAYVSLLEYGGMEGLILPSELSKRRVRSISKLIRVGRQEVVMVVRVDTEKGYVDLSKKRVAPEDINATEEKFSKSKKVQLTTRQVCAALEMDVAEVNRLAIWPLYKKYGHAYDGLKEAVENPEKAFAGIDCPQPIIDALIHDMKTRLAPQILRIRARIHLSCNGMEGVLAVKRALLKAQDLFEPTKDFELRVHLVASPLYEIVANVLDKAEGLRRVQAALDVIAETIQAVPGGEFRQQGAIVAYGAEEDTKPESEEESSEEEEDSDEEEEDEGMGAVDSDEDDEEEDSE